MRKLFCAVVAAVCMISCTNSSTFFQRYVEVATFEYNGVDYVNVFGADSVYVGSPKDIGIGWGQDFVFGHKVNESTHLGGFCLSYMQPAGMEDAVKPEGYKKSLFRVSGPVRAQKNTYAIFQQSYEMPQKDFEFLNPTYGTCQPKICWVNNSELVYDALVSKPGATLKLKATGYLKKAQTGSAEIKLAADTVMYNWTKFNLSGLGAVDEIDFELIASDPSIPLYVCIDELSADINIEY